MNKKHIKNPGRIILVSMLVAALLTISASHAANPTIDYIVSIPAQDPTPGSTTAVDIWFVASDEDGSNTLDNSTAASHFNKTGEATRSNTSCSPETINGTAINYTCSVDMQFYDASGTWTINVTVDDNESNTAYNDTTNFTYNPGTHMNMTPTAVNFGTLNVGDQDKNATDDPLVVQNIGNVNITAINVTAYDLVGESYPSYTIPAENFECDGDDVADGETALVNNTQTQIGTLTIARGSSSKQNLYYHVDVPSSEMQVQTYITAGGTDWVVMVVS